MKLTLISKSISTTTNLSILKGVFVGSIAFMSEQLHNIRRKVKIVNTSLLEQSSLFKVAVIGSKEAIEEVNTWLVKKDKTGSQYNGFTKTN